MHNIWLTLAGICEATLACRNVVAIIMEQNFTIIMGVQRNFGAIFVNFKLLQNGITGDENGFLQNLESVDLNTLTIKNY